MKKILLLTFLLVIFAYPLTSIYGYVSPGNPAGFVNDYAGIFDAEQKASLETKLSNFEKETTNEISVVTINSLEGDTIENYAERLFKEWGIGKSGEDNGALILIAIEDRQMRIEVGYGLEGDLTDLLSSRIIRETLTPAFQQGDFFGGVDKAVDQVIGITEGNIPTELEQGENINQNLEETGQGLRNFNLVWFVLIAITWFASALARSKSWWAGGIVGGLMGIIISLFFGFIFTGIIAVVILVPLGLLFDFLVSKAYSKSKIGGSRPPWWTGGGGWGGGGGSGGFGGFGGGMSGGGGASGRW